MCFLAWNCRTFLRITEEKNVNEEHVNLLEVFTQYVKGSSCAKYQPQCKSVDTIDSNEKSEIPISSFSVYIILWYVFSYL